MKSNSQGGRGRSKSKELFGGWFGKKNKSEGAIISPLLEQDEHYSHGPPLEAQMVQPGKGSKPTFSLGIIGSSTSPVRTLDSPKEAHDMYSRLPSGDFGDEDDEDESANFLRGGVRTNGSVMGGSSFNTNVNNKGGSYMPSMNAVEMTSSRSIAEKRAINNDALERQRRNNEKFMQQMRQEEDRAIADYARRKSQEEESLRLAMQLQAQEEQYAMQQQQLSLAQQQSAVSQRAAQQQVRRKRVVVPLPPNASPGQVLRVQVPGHGLMSVQVPQGATPGQALEFYVAPPQQMEVKKVRVVLPQNAVPGQNITVKVPGVGTHVTVKVPQGANPGNTVEFMVQVPTNAVAEDVAPQMDQKERQEFLQSLPEDIRNEILEAERAERARMTGGVAPQEEVVEDRMSAAEKKAFYDSLPPEIREEVMAQEHMQQKAMTKKNTVASNEANNTRVVESSPVVVVNDAPTDHNASAMTNLNLDEVGNNIAMKKPAAVGAEEDLSLGFNDDSEAQDAVPLDGDDGPLLNLEENDEDDASKAVPTNPPAPQLELPPNPPPQPFQPNPIHNAQGKENPFASYQQQQQQARAPLPQTAQASGDLQTQQAGGVAAEKPLDRLRKAKELLNEGLIEQEEYDEIKKVVMAQLKGRR